MSSHAFANPRRKKSISNVIFFIYLFAILISGFAYPLGYHPNSGLLERGWFMFYRDPGWICKLSITGLREDGRWMNVDMRRWFHYRAAFESYRYNEMSRRPESLNSLADYVCTRFNEKAAPGARLVSLKMEDIYWHHTPGRRRYLVEVPDRERFYDPLLENYACHSGERR